MMRPDDRMKRLGLGTVQFGLDYGISNPNGKTTLEEARQIIEQATRAGITVIDTASAYGDSEKVLGRILPPDHNFHIITKTRLVRTKEITSTDVIQLTDGFQRSLENLGTDKIYGLMIHNADDLAIDGGELLFEALQRFKSQGIIEKFGVSVYNSEQIDNLLAKYSFDLIQLSINVFDQRLLERGYLSKLKKAGVEIHARSIFLQGLLLMNGKALPQWFEPVKPEINRYFLFLKEKCLAPHAAALSFVKNIKEVDCIIVGVNSAQHLIENVKAFNCSMDEDFSDFALSDEKFINPSFWKV